MMALYIGWLLLYILFLFLFIFSFIFFFFFFQAEDGIRDWSVTGVQTCALPISFRWPRRARLHLGRDGHRERTCRARHSRSEERRVGKECRSRWSPYQ